MAPEVLLYIMSVKKLIDTNETVKDHLLSNGNEEFFFGLLTIMSQQNFEETGDAKLSDEQFEEIRLKTLDPYDKGVMVKGIFVSVPDYGIYSLN